MNSCMYETKVMHRRIEPKKHGFVHRFFYFYLDLDEIDEISDNIKYISRNRFNLHAFFDSDHLTIGGKDVKENICKYVQEKGVKEKISKVMLVTMLRSLGYVFNPVSFYYCFDEENQIRCIVAEVQNTFLEQKLFFIDKSCAKGEQYNLTETQYFYISPFMDMDNQLDFIIRVPNEKLSIRVDVLKQGKKIFYASLTGQKVELTNKNILKYNLRYPWVTLKAMFLIHIHGIILLFKKVPFFWKTDRPGLQRNMLRPWKGNKKEGDLK